MWADGQTDLTKLIVAFRNFFERAKKTGITHMMKISKAS